MVTMFEIIVVIFSVVLHEIAHGAAAHAMGDTTAKDLGRLTLNPFKHLDLVGSVLLPIFTFFATGFIFGYAKPVPYNPLNLRDRKFGPAKVALAGPLVNLVLAVLFGLAARFLPIFLQNTIIPELFSFIVLLNLTLAVFNLMPVPPLDGHWLLLTFLPDKFQALKLFIIKYGTVLFIFFLFFIFPILIPLIYFLSKVIVG